MFLLNILGIIGCNSSTRVFYIICNKTQNFKCRESDALIGKISMLTYSLKRSDHSKETTEVEIATF
jgi:hypothetical protein